MEAPLTRVCNLCGEEKPLDEFPKRKQCKGGISTRCRKCATDLNRQWRKDNPEKCKKTQKKYRSANAKKVKEGNRRYRAAHPEKGRENSRRYREAHPEKIKESENKFRAANRETIRERAKLLYAAHPEKGREAARRYREAHPEKVKIDGAIRFIKDQTGITKDQIPQEVIDYVVLRRKLKQKIKDHETS